MPIAFRFALLAAAVLLAALLSLAIGQRSDVGLANVLQLLFVDDGSLARSAVVDLRLPRTLVAGLIGINLALAGLALQAVTRNPLASESVLGINQGAALGRSAGARGAVADGGQSRRHGDHRCGRSPASLTFAIAGGLGGRLDSMRLILAGVTVGAFSFAFVRFTFTLEDNLSRLVLNWTSADISSTRFDQALPLMFWASRRPAGQPVHGA